MHRLLYPILFIIIGLTSACDKVTGGYKYNTGTLPEAPVNLTAFNTEHDDYNSTAPSLGELIPFCFSTNRTTFGRTFDVIYQPMNVNFDKTSGELTVTNEYANWSSIKDNYEIIKTGVSKIKTSGNEYGPNLILEDVFNEYKFTLMYSSDESGGSQIKFTSSLTDSAFSAPREVTFLNSEFEDLYPTLNADRSKIYFCSNRSGEPYNFYSVDVNAELDVESNLSDTSHHEVSLESSLSSSSNDKCPFIYKDKLVFASDRPGGFGGYDLYHSTFVDGAWSEPTNFGDQINSASDEFRPILIDEGVSTTQTMMVFSSNRAGGLGGFDLYFLGIDSE